MALIPCVECKREISTLATACPGCGAPVSASLAVKTASTPASPPALASPMPQALEPKRPSPDQSPAHAALSSQSSSSSALMYGGFAVLVVGIIAVVAWKSHGDSQEDSNATSTSGESEREYQPSHGGYCFKRVNNSTGEEWWDGCGFTRSQCDDARIEASIHATGIHITDCEKVPWLWGVWDGGHSWYGLSRSEDDCLKFWRHDGHRLNNVQPGCRETSSPRTRIPEPPRPEPTWPPTLKERGKYYCVSYSPNLGGRCWADKPTCEREREKLMYVRSENQCEKSAAFFYSIGDEVVMSPDETHCYLMSEDAWHAGKDASTCAPAP